MTIQEYAARTVEKGAEALRKAVGEMPEVQQTWKPLGKGRTALDQVIECAVMNGIAALLVQRQTATDDLFGEWEQAYAALDTPEKALAALRENTARLAAAVRATPDEALKAPIVLPWISLTLAEAFLLPYWNMAYHEGQINYIQTLIETPKAPPSQ